jgi:hypothetical protein
LGNNASPIEALNRTPGVYQALTNNDVSNATYASLFPNILVEEGLDIQPWYQNPNLITGNPRLRKEVQPVTFKIFLEDFILSDQGRTGRPIEIQLNASMKSYNLTQKHLCFPHYNVGNAGRYVRGIMYNRGIHESIWTHGLL